MSVKASQAFAAFRQSLVMELNQSVLEELLPNFNAEVADIRRNYEEAAKVAEEAPTEVAKNTLLNVASATRKSRILDLAMRKNEFIESLRSDLKSGINKKIEEYKGTTYEEDEVVGSGEKAKTRTVLKVKFPDGSIAKVPRNLYIDFSKFDRV